MAGGSPPSVVRAAILVALAAAPSALATPIYMKVEGIDGDVTAAGHEKWIRAQSYQWGVPRPGKSKRRGAPCANVHDLRVVKVMDKASPGLQRMAATRHRIPSVELDLGGERHRLMDVLVKSVKPGGSSKDGKDIPLEEISFNYSKCSYHFPEQKETGKPKPTPSWDVKQKP